MSSVAHPVWRTATGGPLPYRDWDGDYVVYNPLSGNTHILDIVSGVALTFLFEGPREPAALYDHVARFLEVPNDASLATNIDRVLEVLAELGLVEPVTQC